MNRKRTISVGSLPRSASAASLGSLGRGNNVNVVSEEQNSIIRMLNKLQYRKEKYDRGTMWGIFGLGIISIIAGLSAMIVECITKLKYPNASAALLSIEVIGIAFGVCATLQGILSIISWRMSQYGHKGCLIGMLKSFCSIILVGSFVAFCLSLIAYGIYTTLQNWQRKVSPFLAFQTKVVKKIGREDLGFPTEILEELAILKAATFSFHLIIFVTTGFTSILCLLNGYISAMPDFGGCASALSAAGKMLTLKRP